MQFNHCTFVTIFSLPTWMTSGSTQTFHIVTAITSFVTFVRTVLTKYPDGQAKLNET